MSGTAYFFLCLALLLGGYFVYGVVVEKVFGVDRSRPTPLKTKADGVDYVELPLWRMCLIQFLNIAGLGPVFGPLVGALYGPAALLWIVFGCIFAGAVHDFVAAMMSLRYGGASYPEIIGRNLGPTVRRFLTVFTVFFMIMVGAVFTTGPANLLTSISSVPPIWWAVIITLYYLTATILPINVIIARVYPVFGGLLVFMALALITALFAGDYDILPQVNLATLFSNNHPGNVPLWPGLFVVIACSAISGFHATQSPLMARCMKSEAQGRTIFYGSMIFEGIIGLIWCTLGLSFYTGPEALAAAGPAPVVVKDISYALLGTVGGAIAVLGVIVLPVSTGDTAFCCARLIVAESLHIDQSTVVRRLLVALPLFACCILLNLLEFNVIWRYFGWMNQTIACVCLWACSVYLARRGRFHWVTTIPALFMTTMATTFICNAGYGLGLSMTPATVIGCLVAALCLVVFLRRGHTMPDDPVEHDA